MGFEKNNRNGMLVLKKERVVFSLPNQKLPFLKNDFYVKNAYAELDIDNTEVGITVYDGVTFNIEINHYRHIVGVINKKGKVLIDDNTLNNEEIKFYIRHKKMMNDTLKQVVEIYNSVYIVKKYSLPNKN